MKKEIFERQNFEEPEITTYTDDEIMTRIIINNATCASCGFCVF